MEELLQQFVIEAAEQVQQAADDLLSLEREPASRPHIESLFRAVHTLKGSVGLFDFEPLQRTLFDVEDMLSAANRAGEVDAAMIDPMMAIIAWVDRCVQHIATHHAMPEAAAPEGARLSSALAGSRQNAVVPADAGAPPDWAARLFAEQPTAASAIRYVPRADCFFSGDDPVAFVSSVSGLLAVRVGTVAPWPDPAAFDPFNSNLSFEFASTASRQEIEKLFRLIPDQVSIVSRPPATPQPIALVSPPPAGRRSMRVEAERVDALIDIVGELFVAKNAMSVLVNAARQLEGGLPLSRDIAAAQEEFDRLASRMKNAATGVRMVPLNETLRRLPRLVREVSVQLGKLVDLDLEGGSVEADKTVVDALFEPLLHVLRNAVDHGIEPAEIRRARGKPDRGTIVVRARLAGDRIEITVSDDGGGVDIERVRQVAIERGVLSAEQAMALGDSGVIELLFHSGLSTAALVSDVSGRGVGMDAVRRDVQKLGGRVTLASEAGRGTIVTLSFPTSFAVAAIVIVTVGGERYAIAMDSIVEMLRVDAAAISPIRAGEAVVLRDRTLPVLRLACLLGHSRIDRQVELLIVVDVAGQRVGLVVDAIGDRIETLVRPAGGILKSLPGISGTTLTGDGSVVVVLNLEDLIQ